MVIKLTTVQNEMLDIACEGYFETYGREAKEIGPDEYDALARAIVYGNMPTYEITEDFVYDTLGLIENKKNIGKAMNKTDYNKFKTLKEKFPEAILWFREGDFFECYMEDAEACGKTLGITVTKRTDMVDMASFPHYAIDTYLPKMIRAGYRVAICDELKKY